MNGDAPPVQKTSREMTFDIVNVLCGRFMGLSPFEVLNTDIGEVYGLYVDCIIHDYKEKNNGTNKQEEWVTSKNATWH